MEEGLARYRNIQRQVQDGTRPWYRLASSDKYNRALRKAVKSRRWYGDKDAVHFVEPSPRGVFKTAVQRILDGNGFNVKVVEKAGASVRSKLQRSDVSGGKRCADQECAVCSRSQKGNCWKESVGYEISCLDCAEGGDRYVYIGETGRTAKVRCGEHLDDLEKRKGGAYGLIAEMCMEDVLLLSEVR